MNNFTKMLAISCASVMMITNYGTAQNCVRPVQGFVSLGLFGAQSKIKGDFSKLGKLKDPSVLKMLKQTTNGGLEIIEIDKDKLKNLVKIKPGDLKYSNFDKDNVVLLMQTSDSTNDIGSGEYKPLVVKPVLEVKNSDDGQSVILEYKTDFTGEVEEGGIMPARGIYYDYFHKSNGDYVDKVRTDAIDSNTALPTGEAAKLKTFYDAKHPAPTISQSVTLDTSNLKDTYQIKISDINSNNSWTGKGWQMAGFVKLGLLVNFAQGGSWYLAFFGSKPFVNSTQKITFGDANSNNDKNNNNIEAKDKWGLGIETGLRAYFTEKVYLGIGGGLQWNWYEFSLKNSGSTTDNSTSETLKQEMKGTAPFMKLSLGFNINKNFGVEIYGQYTAKNDLKYKDSKKSDKDDKNSNSNSNKFVMDFTKQGAPSFGVALMLTF